MIQESVTIGSFLTYLAFTMYLYFNQLPWPRDVLTLSVMGIIKSVSILSLTPRHYDNRRLSNSLFDFPFLYYALGDMVMMFDIYYSIPWFCIGHVLAIHQIRKEEDVRRPLWLDMFLLLSILPIITVIHVYALYLLYTMLLVKMSYEGYKNELIFPIFLIVSDIFIITETATTMLTWALYYIFIIELSIHIDRSINSRMEMENHQMGKLPNK